MHLSAFERVTLLLALLGTAINLAALSFLGIQVRSASAQAKHATAEQVAEHTRQQRRDTIEAANRTARYREELKAALPWDDRDKAKVEEFLANAEKDVQARRPIRAYLNYFEMLAVGVHQGVFDLSTLTRISGGSIIAVATNYASYIERRREELNAPQLYSELITLARTIQARNKAVRTAEATAAGLVGRVT
jgi:Domain of unknown function (DUF4760)